jgi:hypothetical protein
MIKAPETTNEVYLGDFYRAKINGDTINIIFSTGPGIDTLEFALIDNFTKAEMIITATRIEPDHTNYIDLISFSPGRFVFDMKKIEKCQRENINEVLIECEGLKFYQLQYKNMQYPFIVGYIKPFDLEYFAKK